MLKLATFAGYIFAGGDVPAVLRSKISIAVIGQAACEMVKGSTINSGSVVVIVQLCGFIVVPAGVTTLEAGPHSTLMLN